MSDNIVRKIMDERKLIEGDHFYDGKTRSFSSVIADSSLSRILTLNNTVGFAVVTSFQPDSGRSLNTSTLRDMMKDIYSSGYGFFEVYGKYFNNERGVEEKNISLFIPRKPRPDAETVEDFESMLVRLMNDAHYQNQESILLSDGGSGYLIFPDGSKEYIGRLNFNTKNEYGETILSYGKSGNMGKTAKFFTFKDKVQGPTNSVNSYYYGRLHHYQCAYLDRVSGDLVGYGYYK